MPEPTPSQTVGPVLRVRARAAAAEPARRPDASRVPCVVGRRRSTAAGDAGAGRAWSRSGRPMPRAHAPGSAGAAAAPRRTAARRSSRSSRAPSARRQAPHLTLLVFARGLLKPVLTRCTSRTRPGANAADPVLRSLVRGRACDARRQRRPTTGCASTSTCRASGETVFFAHVTSSTHFVPRRRCEMRCRTPPGSAAMLEAERALATAEATAGVDAGAAAGRSPSAAGPELFDPRRLAEARPCRRKPGRAARARAARAGRRRRGRLRALRRDQPGHHRHARRCSSPGGRSALVAGELGAVAGELRARWPSAPVDPDGSSDAAAAGGADDVRLQGRRLADRGAGRPGAAARARGAPPARAARRSRRHPRGAGRARARGGAAVRRELGLAEPALPWHADRTAVAELGAALADLCGCARQDRLRPGAAFADGGGRGRGGGRAAGRRRCRTSGTRSARRSPSPVPGAPCAEAAVLLGAMVAEHERAAGGWQAEWSALSGALAFTAGAADALARALDGLTVDAERMRRNLDATGGLVMAGASPSRWRRRSASAQPSSSCRRRPSAPAPVEHVPRRAGGRPSRSRGRRRRAAGRGARPGPLPGLGAGVRRPGARALPGGAGMSVHHRVDGERAAGARARELAGHDARRCGIDSSPSLAAAAAWCATTIAGTGARRSRPGPTRSPTWPATSLELLDALELERVVVLRPLAGRRGRHVAGGRTRRSGSTGWCSRARRRASGRPSRGWSARATVRARDRRRSRTPWSRAGSRRRSPASGRRWWSGFRGELAATPREGYAACCEAIAGWDFDRKPAATCGAGARDRAAAHDPAAPPAEARATAAAVPGAVLLVLGRGAPGEHRATRGIHPCARRPRAGGAPSEQEVTRPRCATVAWRCAGRCSATPTSTPPSRGTPS